MDDKTILPIEHQNDQTPDEIHKESEKPPKKGFHIRIKEIELLWPPPNKDSNSSNSFKRTILILFAFIALLIVAIYNKEYLYAFLEAHLPLLIEALSLLRS